MLTLTGILRNQFQTSPAQTAITLQQAGQADMPISAARLLENAAAYAALYKRHGIQPGEVVILILEHGEQLVYSFFGAVLQGAVPAIMPFLTEKLSPERYRADLADLIAITQPAAILTYPQFEVEIQAALVGTLTAPALLLTSEVSGPAALDFELLPGSSCPPDSVAVLQHSSGTTGLQKGVALSHTAILNQLEAYRTAIRLTSQDVIVSWLPLYHDMGLIAGFLMPILSGVPLVLMSPFDWVRAPQRLLQSVSQYRGTLAWMPNFAYNFCTQKIRERMLEGVDLSSWRAIINCSEPVRWESHSQFLEKFKPYGLKESALQTSYAMAENVFGVTQSDLTRGPLLDEIDRQGFLHQHVAQAAQDGQPSMRMLSSGRPLANTEIRISGEKGRILPERQIGEICLRSNSMLSGYFHREDATEKALRNGWYYTGDYGYMAGGELFVTGRKKDIIIIGGKNVYPQDIEMLVSQVPGVHAGRTVAFGVFDETQGTEEVVVIAETDEQQPEALQHIADEVRRYVTKNSAVALRLVQLVEPRWLLKTSSGKTARAANKEKYLAETILDKP